MMLSEAPGAVKQLRKKAWRFQKTFAVPFKNLQAFVKIVVSDPDFQGGCLTIDRVIFEPKKLIRLLGNYSIAPQYGHGVSITAHSQAEASELLEAALGDSLDFIFTPVPKSIVLFADHDEYMTFFANTRSNLNRVVTALSGGGFREIRDYERQL